MKLSEELQLRGFIHQNTGESLDLVIDDKKRIVYHGIDPTADSAHAGNMVIWMLLRHLSDAGHKIIFLIGGGTGMIGDPKPDAERTLQSVEDIDVQVNKIKLQAQMLIGSGESEVEFVNNKDWLLEQGLLTFLRDIGKHFTVNELIKKDAISKRLEGDTGISYTEFAYPLLQAFDYLTLHKKYGCDLQVGGSDQWGNIISGVDLIRRKEQKTVHAVTVPLVVDKATGKKFGKSEGNAVWLSSEKTSPYSFYQFWLNVADDSVIDYLKLFTLISLEDISEIEKDFAENPGSRSAQKRLAQEVTTFVHGEGSAKALVRVSAALFGEVSFGDLSEDEVSILKENAPLTTVTDNVAVVDVLVGSGLATSKREARTFVEGGAVQINGNKIDSIDAILTKAEFGALVLLKRGKKNLSLIEIG